MAFSVKDIIWGLFGERADRRDLFKDADGKGLLQRFNELLAGDFDDNEGDLLNNLVARTRDPNTMLDRFVPYAEDLHGLPTISDQIYIRRKLINLYRQLINRKGTKIGYEMLLLIMGFDTVTINEIPNVSGFDSPILLDNPVRLFDQKCKTCSDYDVLLTGSILVDGQVLVWILNSINWNEPINATLRFVTYNGAAIIGPGSDIIGDGSTTSFAIGHPFLTRDVLIQIFETFGNFENVNVQNGRESVLQVRITFTVAPAIGENYRVIVRNTLEAHDIIGTGFAVSFPIAHALGTRNILVQVYDEFSGDYDTADVEIQRTDANTATVIFSVAPPIGENYRVVMLNNTVEHGIVGDGFETDFTFGHSLGTKDFLIQVIEEFGDRRTVDVTIEHETINQVKVIFSVAPGGGDAYRFLLRT